MRDRGFSITEVGRDRYQACRIDQLPAGFFTTLEFKRNNTAKTALLLFGQFMLWMTLRSVGRQKMDILKS